MDDILIFVPTRWKLKKAIRVMNQTFNQLRLEQHPDKALIGRSERGFYFLGYHFKPTELSIADKTIERFKKCIARLYEQGANSVRIGQYVRKWLQWVVAWPLTVQYHYAKATISGCSLHCCLNYPNRLLSDDGSP